MSVPSLQTVQWVQLVLYQGEPFVTQLILYNADGTLVDLTGCAAEMQVRQYVPDATAIADWSTANGTIVLGGTAGTLTFAVTTAMTQALPTANIMQNWDADIFVTSAGGIPQKVAYVTLTIVPAVTRP